MKRMTLKKPSSKISEDGPLLAHMKALADKFPVVNNKDGSVTIYIDKKRDGSYVARTFQTASAKSNAGLTKVNGAKKKLKVSHGVIRRVAVLQTATTRSVGLTEESLEETQAIARNIDENLLKNKDFYQRLKNLVIS